MLVIDDEPEVRAVLQEQLRAEGHEVFEAGDGDAAFRLLAEHPVDLVIADLYMPGMDGIEFTIRLGRQHPRPKIIAISGGGWRDKTDILEVAERLGAARTLAKPFTREQLVTVVRELLW
ncbi:MAG: response regulator [Gemmatimonadetes bacterium]|nr:response regulator [Gemmatimonadota bacterium]